MEDNNCPKPDCGRPESTHRYSAGKKLSICGNGHSWDAQEVAAHSDSYKADLLKRHQREIDRKMRELFG